MTLYKVSKTSSVRPLSKYYTYRTAHTEKLIKGNEYHIYKLITDKNKKERWTKIE